MFFTGHDLTDHLQGIHHTPIQVVIQSQIPVL
jgi:hypothetical protein